VGVGVPRRHPPVEHHLADHRRVAPDLLVASHRERPDLAGAVAADALVLQHRRDVAGVGDLAAFRQRGVGDRAAVGFGLRDGDGPSGEEIFQGVLQVMLRRRRLAGAFGKLVVHGAAVDDFRVLGVDRDRLGGPGDVEVARDELLLVAEDRRQRRDAEDELQRLLADRLPVAEHRRRHEVAELLDRVAIAEHLARGELAELVHRVELDGPGVVLRRRVDHPDRDALLAVRVGQRLQLRPALAGDGAVGAGEKEHDDLRGGAAQLVVLA
jgi:hypothetical protein